MTLRHMKIFVTVYQHSSVTKAAGDLHLAQPSVSLAVKELEEYYGIRLFERIGRRICPTEAGNEFYSYALHIVSLFEDMEKKDKKLGHSGHHPDRHQYHHRHSYSSSPDQKLSGNLSFSQGRSCGKQFRYH